MTFGVCRHRGKGKRAVMRVLIVILKHAHAACSPKKIWCSRQQAVRSKQSRSPHVPRLCESILHNMGCFKSSLASVAPALDRAELTQALEKARRALDACREVKIDDDYNYRQVGEMHITSVHEELITAQRILSVCISKCATHLVFFATRYYKRAPDWLIDGWKDATSCMADIQIAQIRVLIAIKSDCP